MVRFHWICDGGQNSFVPPQGVNIDEPNGVTHVNCEMEVSVQHWNGVINLFE
jgi:flagellar motor switch protein FliM